MAPAASGTLSGSAASVAGHAGLRPVWLSRQSAQAPLKNDRPVVDKQQGQLRTVKDRIDGNSH